MDKSESNLGFFIYNEGMDIDKEQHIKRYRESKSKARNPRDEYIEKFLERINTEDRRLAGYKDMTEKELVGRVHRAYDNSDAGILYLLYKRCDKFDNFSKGFTYLTRTPDKSYPQKELDL